MKFITKILSRIRSVYVSYNMLFIVSFLLALNISKSIAPGVSYWTSLFVLLGAHAFFSGLCTLICVIVCPVKSKIEVVDAFHDWLIMVTVFLLFRVIIPSGPIWLMITLWIVLSVLLFIAAIAWDIHRMQARRSRLPTLTDEAAL